MKYTRHQIAAIMTSAQCFLNTEKIIRHEMESYNGDSEPVVCRKERVKRSDWLRTRIHPITAAEIDGSPKQDGGFDAANVCCNFH